mgnify:FL=1|tara:strand:+ start:321 stop:533 length:213 start_codon:yes stop_codon:yes gene_type:complete
MKEFKMKEATNKEQAIISLLDVQKNKPELLPTLIKFNQKELQELKFTEVRDLFIHVKTMYYSSIDWSKKF